MTNGFSVDPTSLPGTASVLSAAGSALRGVHAPDAPDAGRSSDEIAAAVRQVVEETSALGTAMTELAAAFETAARSYAATDEAVAAGLSRWAT